jgi:hypothetical protein
VLGASDTALRLSSEVSEVDIFSRCFHYAIKRHYSKNNQTKDYLHTVENQVARVQNIETALILANRQRATLLPLCRQTLNAVPPSQTTPEISTTQKTHALCLCPHCGGPMVVIERLTAAQVQLRSPPFLVTAVA